MKSLQLLAVFLLAACSGSTEPQPLPSGTEVVLELGKSAKLDGSGITVGFANVEDSRCPGGDIVCIWEGNAQVTLTLSAQGGPEIAAQLNTHPNYPQALTFRYVRVELLGVDPVPSGTRPVTIYRAHLKWSYLPD